MYHYQFHVQFHVVIDQSATENKVIHTLIIDFFSHGLRSVKIEQELEIQHFATFYVSLYDIYTINTIKQ
jgi:hypothetical protein